MYSNSAKYPEAIILCGGKGLRLRPITSDIPKPLIKINDKPILYYVIEHLIKYNITQINIAAGYKSDSIKQYISNTNYNANIKIYDSGDVDIIKRIQDILKTVHRDVIVLYGDTISNVNIGELIRHHKESLKSISMTVWPFKVQYGLVEINDNGMIKSFIEKPTLDKWINIGYFYINKSYINVVSKYNSFVELLCHSTDIQSLNAYKHNGLHITVNTLSELEEAQINIKNISG